MNTQPLKIHGDPLRLPIDAKKAECETFEHSKAGKGWTKWLGGTCPLRSSQTAWVQNREGQTWDNVSSEQWSSLDAAGEIYSYSIPSADAEPEKVVMVPLEAKDVPPGSVFKAKYGTASWVIPVAVLEQGIFQITKHDTHELFTWDQLKAGADEAQINRSIPLTGRWNPEAWEPCSKKA